jgi:bacteriocin biosynthesis cyclodehydratase domain-containing protein
VLVLHPAVKVIPVRPEALNLRGPGVNLTFRDPAGEIETMLTSGRVGPSAELPQVCRTALATMRRHRLLVSTEEADRLTRLPDDHQLKSDLMRRRLTAVPPQDDQTVVDAMKIGILGEGRVADELHRQARDVGLEIVSSSESTPHGGPQRHDTVMIVCDDLEDHQNFLEHNKRFVSEGTIATFSCACEDGARIGPFLYPGSTACYHCYFTRLRNGMEFIDNFDGFVSHQAAQTSASYPRPNLAAAAAATLTLLEIVNFFSKAPNLAGLGYLVELSFSPPRLRRTEVLRLPRCPVCGSGRDHVVAESIRDARMWR